MLHGLQRLSVIVTDAVFLSGLWLATREHCVSQKKVVRIMVAANAGLLIVDHIHFQYNGLLLGDSTTDDTTSEGSVFAWPESTGYLHLVMAPYRKHIKLGIVVDLLRMNPFDPQPILMQASCCGQLLLFKKAEMWQLPSSSQCCLT